MNPARRSVVAFSRQAADISGVGPRALATEPNSAAGSLTSYPPVPNRASAISNRSLGLATGRCALVACSPPSSAISPPPSAIPRNVNTEKKQPSGETEVKKSFDRRCAIARPLDEKFSAPSLPFTPFSSPHVRRN
ncbi:hypothetical protein MRX96_046260 [Rhipicephalus microplus]